MKNRCTENLFGPSTGDKLLSGACTAKIELMRFENDDGSHEVHCQYELCGSIEDDAAALLADVLRVMQGPKGGDCHA